mgnify:CR=1 FL=1
MQLLNSSIYGKANDQIYPRTTDILFKIVGCASLTQEKGIAKGNRDLTIHYSVMTFSWAMAFANRRGRFDIVRELYRHFAACPYCGSEPCDCKRGVQKPKRMLFAEGQPLWSVEAFQRHIAEVYPKNTLARSGSHLAAESVELMQAVLDWERSQFDAIRSEELIAAIHEEYSDVIAHLVAIAHCGEFDLARETIRIFKDGCCECHLPECKCPYTNPVRSRSVTK